MPDGDRYPKSFGPYLRYAISTGFRNFALFGEQSKLFLLAEFKDPAKTGEFIRKMEKAKAVVDLGPSDGTRYFTIIATKSAAAGDALDVWDDFVTRVELSLPLRPTLAPAFRARTIQSRADGDDPTGPVLIGILDDGCPFAAAHFLKATTSGSAQTRVRAIWDQNPGEPINVDDADGNPCEFGAKLLGDFNYGIEFRRASDKPGAAAGRKIGLNEWIALHTVPSGSIDEDGCYADAGFARVAYHASHGAHVMDLFAGRIPPSARIGPATDRRGPPSWKPSRPEDDPAGHTNDVVFVQFADECLRDATGVWLTLHVYNAILYILSHADAKRTERVVINLSYGPTTGPHNGTSLLEEILTTFVTEYDSVKRKPKLEIVLAAGNAYSTDGHVTLCRGHGQPDHAEWTWRLPPDNSSACFAEIWTKTTDAGPVGVTLTSPSGKVYVPTAPIVPPPNPPPPASVDLPIPWGGYDTVWSLRIEPTIAYADVVAEHGDWTIKVTGIRENAELHAYVARTDPNMNQYTGAKASCFVDPVWERDHSASAGCTRVNGEFDRSGSRVVRHGTLNGIATAKEDRVCVAGGHILSNGRKSAYSSAGPARSGPYALRRGPDYLLPCDESYALGGMRGGGNRTGSVIRLTGTSAAAPQLARWVLRTMLPQPTHGPVNPTQEEERGYGNLEPP